MDGFLNLNKPFGLTSHDCVARVRRALHMKRVGHAGTLDPAATGVLPIALGKATRLLQFLKQDKAYQATVRLGVRTTTDDLEGEILQAKPVPDLTLGTVEAALPAFIGFIQQIPPVYSAIQVEGKRLYQLARTGQEITIQPRQVEVFKIQVLDWRPGEFPEIELAITCGPGTYIRAIARDLGEVLQTGGTLASLTRTASSGFDLQTSLTLEELESQVLHNEFQPVLPETVLTHLPAIVLPAPEAHRWCLGQRIVLEGTAANLRVTATEPVLPSAWRIHHETGKFLGIGQLKYDEKLAILAPQVVYGELLLIQP